VSRAPWAVVARREYVSRLRSASFLIGTLVGPLVLIVASSAPAWLGNSPGAVAPAVGVIDCSGVLDGGASHVAVDVARELRMVHIPPELGRDVMSGLVADRALDAVVMISPDGARAELIAGSAVDPEALARLRGRLEPMLYEALVHHRATLLPLDEEMVRELTAPPAWTLTTLECVDPARAASFALVMGMILYATLLTYGLATMRAVVEEKAGGVVELLLSSARPVDLLAGKILGIASIGVTQYLMWAAVAAVIIVSRGSLDQLAVPLMGQPAGIGLAAACIAYFVLGYALFASLYAVAGGMVSSLADAQHVHLPVTALLIAPVFLVWFVVTAPESTAARIVSQIPVFAPMLMVARLAMNAASVGEVALSVVVLSATGLASFHLAARVYRAGILMRGKPATPKEVMRWIRE